MPTQQIDANVWKQRSETLSTLIQDASSRFRDNESFNAVHVAEILGHLDLFHKQQFSAFWEGFFGNGGSRPMRRSKLYPPAYVLEQLLTRTAIDLNALVQIYGQRRSISQQEERYAEQVALTRADALAQDAIQPAIHAGIVSPEVRALTYFQKMASIRVIPYFPVALLGAPYTCVGIARDFLAIPHEVAHYLYWHGSFGPALPYQKGIESLPIHEQLDEVFADEPWQHWTEELFADVYGACVGGPAIALSFQDMQLSVDGNRFFDNDDDHPAPILRPRIYVKVLGRHYPEWAAEIDARWEEVLGSLDSLDTVGGDGSTTHVDEIISPGTDLDTSKPLDRMIAVILDAIGELSVPDTWCGYLCAAEKSAPSIYASFEASMNAFSPEPPEVVPPTHPPTRGGAFIKLMAEAMGEKNVRANEEWWYPLARANGWTTKGPKTRD